MKYVCNFWIVVVIWKCECNCENVFILMKQCCIFEMLYIMWQIVMNCEGRYIKCCKLFGCVSIIWLWLDYFVVLHIVKQLWS